MPRGNGTQGVYLCCTVQADRVVLFYVVRRQPRTTVFPYTPLFRSREACFERGHVAVSALWAAIGLALVETGTRRDRKSTRLNSSHSQISYAVFCLKKKTRPGRCLRGRHRSDRLAALPPCRGGRRRR